jgi:transcriptional regulator of acetoin/glycerol metabolism
MNTGDPVTLDELEKEHVLKILRNHPTQGIAARILGVNRKTVYRMCRRWGISRQWVMGALPASLPPPPMS